MPIATIANKITPFSNRNHIKTSQPFARADRGLLAAPAQLFVVHEVIDRIVSIVILTYHNISMEVLACNRLLCHLNIRWLYPKS